MHFSLDRLEQDDSLLQRDEEANKKRSTGGDPSEYAAGSERATRGGLRVVSIAIFMLQCALGRELLVRHPVLLVDGLDEKIAKQTAEAP